MKAIYLLDVLKPTGVGLIKALATFTKSRKHLRGGEGGGGGGRGRERERNGRMMKKVFLGAWESY